MSRNIDFISLGCAKNLVDAEQLMFRLQQLGYTIHHNPSPDSHHPTSDIVIINTCAFIADAKEESINTILQYVEAKQKGAVKRIYVMGCLSQRYREELQREIPEVDAFYGKFDFNNLVQHIQLNNTQTTGIHQTAIQPSDFRRLITTPRHYAYLKIAEGCNKHCAYCIIPHITGHYHSRAQEDILEEVKWLVSEGVKEFQVIAQDLTAYGTDRNTQSELPQLVERIAEVSGVEWIRLHYGYPNAFPWQLLDVMQQHDNICRYIDVALQHVNTPVLERMRRHITSEETYRFVEMLRERCPGIKLRTTLMVGFPGETEDDFEQLMQFVRWARFERLGAFAYSEEEGTYSAMHYKDDVPTEVKQQRLDTLMALQQNISQEIMEQEIGKQHKVIIDELQGDYYIARSEYSSPEVDPEILISAQNVKLNIGQFYQVQITEATPFDLYAECVED